MAPNCHSAFETVRDCSNNFLSARMFRGTFQARQNFFGAFSRNDGTQFFYARTLNIGDASKLLEQFLRGRWPNAGDFMECAMGLALAAALTVKSDGKAMCFIADLLNKMQHGGVMLQNDWFVLLAEDEEDFFF